MCPPSNARGWAASVSVKTKKHGGASDGSEQKRRISIGHEQEGKSNGCNRAYRRPNHIKVFPAVAGTGFFLMMRAHSDTPI
jgi:hypothetical protein